MEFLLLGVFIVVLALAGVRPNRNSYLLIGLAAVVTSIALLVRN